jgi:hypothetical protein
MVPSDREAMCTHFVHLIPAIVQESRQRLSGSESFCLLGEAAFSKLQPFGFPSSWFLPLLHITGSITYSLSFLVLCNRLSQIKTTQLSWILCSGPHWLKSMLHPLWISHLEVGLIRQAFSGCWKNSEFFAAIRQRSLFSCWLSTGIESQSTLILLRNNFIRGVTNPPY